MPNQTLNTSAVLEEKLNDLMIPGFIAELSPEETDLLGAFVEDALSEEEAQEAKNG